MSPDIIPFATLIAVSFFLASISMLWNALIRSRAQRFDDELMSRQTARNTQDELRAALERTVELQRELTEIQDRQARESSWDKHRQELEKAALMLAQTYMPQILAWIYGRFSSYDHCPPAPPPGDPHTSE